MLIMIEEKYKEEPIFECVKCGISLGYHQLKKIKGIKCQYIHRSNYKCKHCGNSTFFIYSEKYLQNNGKGKKDPDNTHMLCKSGQKREQR